MVFGAQRGVLGLSSGSRGGSLEGISACQTPFGVVWEVIGQIRVEGVRSGRMRRMSGYVGACRYARGGRYPSKARAVGGRGYAYARVGARGAGRKQGMGRGWVR